MITESDRPTRAKLKSVGAPTGGEVADGAPTVRRSYERDG